MGAAGSAAYILCLDDFYSRLGNTTAVILDLVHVIDLLALLELFSPWDLLFLCALIDIGKLLID